MAQQTRQQVAVQLNQLQKSGATEKQISDYVAKSGYSDGDFNIDMGGSFTPLTAGAGKVAGVDYSRPTVTEAAQSEQYYKNLSAESSSIQTSTTTFSQSTGGGSVTTYANPSIPTTASQSYASQASAASKEQALYSLNPNSTFGARALDKKLANGEITQEQYNSVKNSTAEERSLKASEANSRYESARNAEEAAKTPGPTSVVVSTSPDSASNTVTNESTNTSSTISGDVPGTNVSTETIDGTTYQVVSSPATDSKSYTNEAGESVDVPNQAPADNSTTVPNTPELNGQVPGLEVSNDGSSIQRFSDGSTIVTNSDGTRTVTPAAAAVPGTAAQSTAVQGPSEITVTASRLSSSTQEFPRPTDWRFRISLAPGAKYFYNDTNPGILLPLKATKGVIFPYTPSIQVAYSANYESSDIAHSNYKIYNYKNSAVESVAISGDFTAQDTTEANYMLAVIHFFRTMTKMFYGQDLNPSRGTPPPLCYLSGFGEYQFDNHPVVITNFSYSMPTDVDYINATSQPGNISLEPYKKASNTYQTPFQRLFGSGLRPGGVGSRPVFTVSDPTKVTRVPTKITLSITCLPVVTRNAISNEFSLQEYSTGSLLRGSRNPGTGGGIW